MLKVLWFVPPAIALSAPREPAAALVSAARTRGSDQQFEELEAGVCDLAITAMDNVIGWNERSARGDYRIIAQVETTTPLCLITRPGMNSLSHLRGRKVLVDSPDNGFVVALLAMLLDAGIRRDELQLIPAGGVSERADALVAGDGDATLLGPPFERAVLQKGMVRLASVNEAYPSFPGQGVVVRQSRVEKLHDEICVWLGALEAGRRFARSEPARAVAAIAATGVPEPVAQAMLNAAPASLTPDEAGVAVLIAHRRALGLPGADSTYRGMVDATLLESLPDVRLQE